MNYKIDHCEPFDGKKENFWMKCEHVGRYLFARDFFAEKGAEKIADVACAEGFGAYLLSKKGFDVLGADINADYIKRAKERCNGKFFVLDFDEDDFPKEMTELDGAVCFETIEHVKNGSKLINGLGKCVKKDGYVLLSFPSDRYEKIDENGINFDPFHLKIYSESEMADVIKKAGFKKVDEYGQSLCNLLYGAETAAVNRGEINVCDVEKVFSYDESSIIALSQVLGYPDKKYLADSYSRIWVLRRL